MSKAGRRGIWSILGASLPFSNSTQSFI